MKTKTETKFFTVHDNKYQIVKKQIKSIFNYDHSIHVFDMGSKKVVCGTLCKNDDSIDDFIVWATDIIKML